MVVYSIILFAVAVLFLIVGLLIRSGNNAVINDYHQKNVKESELPDYCREFAKGMFAVCAALFASGLIALLGGERAAAVALIVLFGGLAVSAAIIVKVQKKYNGGIF